MSGRYLDWANVNRCRARMHCTSSGSHRDMHPSALNAPSRRISLAGSDTERQLYILLGRGGWLEGFTPLEYWTGPEIPLKGTHEKGATRLQPKHLNQFVSDYLRQQIEHDPEYKNVQFY